MVTAAATPPRRARRIRRLVALGFFVIVVIWTVLLVRSSLVARRELLAADVAVTTATSTRNLDAVVASLIAAQAHLVAASSQLDRPWFTPVRWLPLVGRQVESIDQMVGVSRGIVNEARIGLTKISGARADGATISRLTGLAASALGALDTKVRGADLGPRDLLVPPIRDARIRLERAIADAQPSLTRTAALAAGLDGLLRGPRTYLLLAANNAEMAAGSGTYLSVATLQFSGGQVVIGDASAASDLLPVATKVIVPDDYLQLWGFQHPANDLRDDALSPRFDQDAQLATAVYESATGTHVDGALLVDPVALQSLLRVLGPVTVDGDSITADSVLGLLLHDQYAISDVGQRRDRLPPITAEVLSRLTTSNLDPAGLAENLATAIKGRHIMLWARDGAEQQRWTGAGADGSLRANSVMVAVQNRAGNKLDWFLRTKASITDAPVPAGWRAVSITVSLTNNVPDGESTYVTGPPVGSPNTPNEYVGYLTVNLPGDARSATIEATEALVVDGVDGPTRVIGGRVRVPQGGTATAVVSFEIPTSESLQIEPTGRYPGFDWTWRDKTWSDGERRILDPVSGSVKAD